MLTEFTAAIHDKDADAAYRAAGRRRRDVRSGAAAADGAEETHDPAPLEQWFATWESPIVSEPGDLTIAVGGDVAYAYGLQHMTGKKKGGQEADLWFRATACFRREAGRWRITHMHNSVPFAMDGSDKALLDLKP